MPPRARLTPRFVFASAAFVAATSLLPAAAQAERVQVHYDLSLIGVPLGTADARANVDVSHYTIELEAKLTGVANLVSHAKEAATASGAIVNGRLAPESYATTSADTHEKRVVRMAMAAGSVKAVDIEPPFQDAPDRIPVTEDLKHNIIDPLSAVIMAVPGDAPLVGPAACNRVIPVFDGYARFNITLSYVASRTIKIRGYSGPVSVCAARYTPIAGHRPNRPGTKFMENNKQLEVWLAPLTAERVELPLRISVATMVGTTLVEATQVIRQPAPM